MSIVETKTPLSNKLNSIHRHHHHHLHQFQFKMTKPPPILSIELKVISCKDLKSFNFFQKLSVYAAVSIVTEQEQKKKLKKLRHQFHKTPVDKEGAVSIVTEQEQKKKLKKLRHQFHKTPVDKEGAVRHQLDKTPVDKEGDRNPEWNYDVRVDPKEIKNNNNYNILDLDRTFLEFHMIAQGLLFFGEKTIGEVRVPFTDLVGEYNGAVRFISYQVKNTEGKPNGVLNLSYKVIEEEKMKKPKKIRINGLYPEIEVDDDDDVVDNDNEVIVSTSHSPSPPGTQILYPTPAEVIVSTSYSLPPPGTQNLYPTPAEVPYPPPAPEVYCREPPAFYFPPPPLQQSEVAVYPPPPHPVDHGVPPSRYGYVGYSYPMRSYAKVEYRHHSFDENTCSH